MFTTLMDQNIHAAICLACQAINKGKHREYFL